MNKVRDTLSCDVVRTMMLSPAEDTKVAYSTFDFDLIVQKSKRKKQFI